MINSPVYFIITTFVRKSKLIHSKLWINPNQTYDTLLNPFMVWVHQFTTQIGRHLGSFNMRKQVVQWRTNHQTKLKVFFEELWANFRYGFLKETGWTNDIHHMNYSRKIWLKIREKYHDVKNNNQTHTVTISVGISFSSINNSPIFAKEQL